MNYAHEIRRVRLFEGDMDGTLQVAPVEMVEWFLLLMSDLRTSFLFAVFTWDGGVSLGYYHRTRGYVVYAQSAVLYKTRELRH